ncbi:hypothetical protein [Arthrobacter luteolus]|uniref:hypothetical protein n=1 Tax=Arthrobacter luteolus TaxID=98672 RepID=UPI00384E37C3
MEQKLRSALPPRTAWSVLGICALFWLLSAFGLLQMPPSVPPVLMFLWLYLNALATLASAMAAAAAGAALLLHRRESLPVRDGDDQPGPAPVSALEAAEETDLQQLLSEPAGSLEPQPVAAPAGKTGQQKKPQRKKRRTR